jgi:hypothetical protein
MSNLKGFQQTEPLPHLLRPLGSVGIQASQSIIVWTLKTKSLLPPFTKGGIPLFGNPFPVVDRQRGVRGDFQKNMSNQLWTP